MRILVATDSFKDALPAREVCRAIATGLRRGQPEARITEFPLADGGEGSFEVLAQHLSLQTIETDAMDPLFRPIRATYGISADGRTAVIEMAKASGLQLLKAPERNPWYTSSVGTGILLADARIRGARRMVLAVGGSATNDAGTGMATALGWRFLNKYKKEIKPTGGQLRHIQTIERPEWQLSIEQTDVICDVDNPLYGPNGAAWVYGRQKGADASMQERLDAGLRHIAQLAGQQLGRTGLEDIPGAGAAGGLGFGAMAFLNARLRPGIDLMLDLTHFDKALAQAELVVTGEGQLDGQTLHGKLIQGICRRAAELDIPVIALCGRVTATPEQIRAIGLHQAIDINPVQLPLPEMLARTAENLERAAFRFILN